VADEIKQAPSEFASNKCRASMDATTQSIPTTSLNLKQKSCKITFIFCFKYQHILRQMKGLVELLNFILKTYVAYNVRARRLNV